MPTDNPKIPDTWITLDTIKTISGAAICAWLITLFFDLVIFASMSDDRRQKAVIITASVASLGFAVYRIISSKKKEKLHWITILPNAFLIYVHALGFQVSTKEIASRISEPDTKSSQSPGAFYPSSQPAASQAGFNFLSFLTRQTSWLPNLGLSRENKALKNNNDTLLESMRRLRIKTQALEEKLSGNEGIKNMSDRITVLETGIIQARDSIKLAEEKWATEKNNLTEENKKLNATISRLNATIDSLNNLIADLRAKLNSRGKTGNMVDSLSRLLGLSQSRIKEFNSLQQQWVQKTMTNGSAQSLAAQMRRTMDETVSRGYYIKLFTPIRTD
jgi:flagellar biosynthesis chaperone FliJ